ncbi:putative DNA methylase, N-6 adenine-specific, methyltransferase EEF1AKMT1/ZCCHC4 [Helianthus annuus]|nr:putative DNA methylase, N-6 adenine-specific, methyltransferase EEF1AKMT1/ZCCHC4 [Helianthus annuus]
MEDEINHNAVAGAGANDDDTPMLSAHALEALKEFLSEQNGSVAADNDGATAAEEKEVALVTEDWRLSQFWYDRETAETVAREVHALYTSMEDPPSVACIACPTLYVYLKKLHPDLPVQLLEYDKRFEQYGNEFTYYDYNEPLELPSSMKQSFSIIVADPPYLSQECLEKVSETVSFLKKPGESYLLLLTGAVQHDRAAQLLGLRPCGFRPQHSSKLGNEFRLFTNYDPGLRLGGWEQEES